MLCCGILFQTGLLWGFKLYVIEQLDKHLNEKSWREKALLGFQLQMLIEPNSFTFSALKSATSLEGYVVVLNHFHFSKFSLLASMLRCKMFNSPSKCLGFNTGKPFFFFCLFLSPPGNVVLEKCGLAWFSYPCSSDSNTIKFLAEFNQSVSLSFWSKTVCFALLSCWISPFEYYASVPDYLLR